MARPIPWLPIVLVAALATLTTALYTMSDLRATRSAYGGLVSQAPTDRNQLLPWDEIGDSPDATGGPHDGRYFYAIARSFPDLAAARPYLDTPGYRTQRILYPALARLLHPFGNGSGLIWTMFAIGVAGVFLTGFATGALASIFGGRWWVAAIPPLYYGSWVSLRISVPDPLALGFSLAAIACAARSRWGPAIAIGIAAVLTRETSVLLLLGYALWRRDRPAIAFTAIPAAVGAAWGVAARATSQAASSGFQIAGWGLPFAGWSDAIRYWGNGNEQMAPLVLLPVLVASALALVRTGLRHPLGIALALHLALVPFMVGDVLGPVRNASRVALPLVALAVIVLASPAAARAPATARAAIR